MPTTKSESEGDKMGLFDSLTGKVYALNTVLKPAAKMYFRLSETFPERDFLRDYFQFLGFGALAFLENHFENETEHNLLKRNIKAVTSQSAVLLMKLIGIHYTLTFLANDDNVFFINELNLTPEMLMGYLVDSTDINQDELKLFQDLASSFQEEDSVYPVKWVSAFCNLVLLQRGTPPIDEVIITRTALTTSYQIFIELFNS